MKRMRVSPLGALLRGLVAGALGSGAQSLFFKATAKIAPHAPKDAFNPPERAQSGEKATETVARRLVEGMMQRAPLTEERKKAGGQIVHYAFGAAFGGLYGLMRETWPEVAGPLGTAGFSSAVWMVGDNIILPSFGLAAWPKAYPMKTHAYAWGAHLVYGLAVVASYEALRPRSLAVAGATLWALKTNLSLARRLPGVARPALRSVVSSAAKVRARRPLAAVVEARGA